MSYSKEVATKGELALMGIVVSVDSNEQAKQLVAYMAKVIKKEDSIKWDWLENSKTNPQIKAVVVNTLDGMPLFTFALQTKEDKCVFNLTSEEGCFSYVLNLTDPWSSEYGYSYFEKRGTYIRRIG